jgi:hypothetical protein
MRRHPHKPYIAGYIAWTVASIGTGIIFRLITRSLILLAAPAGPVIVTLLGWLLWIAHLYIGYLVFRYVVRRFLLPYFMPIRPERAEHPNPELSPAAVASDEA